MKMNSCFRLLAFLCIPYAASCASYQPHPQAAGIPVVAGTKVPGGCHYRGKVGVMETKIYGPSHKYIEEKQSNILRNQAMRLGANAVIVTNHHTQYYHYPEHLISQGRAHQELDAHSMSGNAYSCNAKGLGSLYRHPLSTDIKPYDE